MGKNQIIAKFHWNILAICSHSRERKTPSYTRRNPVKKYDFEESKKRDEITVCMTNKA